MRVVYVTWDGPRESYLEGLFLPILSRLQQHGHSFHVVQFTTAGREKRLMLSRVAAEAGIRYTPFAVPRSTPLTTAAMIVAGGWLVNRISAGDRAETIMARSTIPAAMALRAIARSARTRLLFDADGFMPDERVDFSSWSPSSLSYRILREVEAQAARRASSVLVRSQWAKDTLLARAGAGTAPEKFSVVRNGRDPGVYRPGNRGEAASCKERLGMPAHAPLLVYAGSLGGKYLFADMLRFFEVVLRQRGDTRLLVLTADLELARRAVAAASLPAESVKLRQVRPAEVPEYLMAADLGLALIAPTFSMRGVSPIKVGEYLLCGVPALCTGGVGDLDAQLQGAHAGRTLGDLGAESLRQAAAWFLDEVLPNRERYRQGARSAGIDFFAHDAAVASYLTALGDCERAAARHR